jgi:hypothetical protein
MDDNTPTWAFADGEPTCVRCEIAAIHSYGPGLPKLDLIESRNVKDACLKCQILSNGVFQFVHSNRSDGSGDHLLKFVLKIQDCSLSGSRWVTFDPITERIQVQPVRYDGFLRVDAPYDVDLEFYYSQGTSHSTEFVFLITDPSLTINVCL